MRASALSRAVLRIVGVLALAVVVSVPGVAQAKTGGGHVLPAHAHPAGYTLRDLTRALALFTTSGNDPAYYPATPFQVLYVDPGTVTVAPDGTGIAQTGTNAFTVQAGTLFYVPVWNADDSPPVVGDFPRTARAAERYFFDPAEVGGRGFQIIVDGRVTGLGPAYLAGPVRTPPLLDGGGTQMMTLGAFLTPLAPGTHTVTVRGGVFGAGVAAAYPFASVTEDFTYTVTVEPRGR